MKGWDGDEGEINGREKKGGWGEVKPYNTAA